MPSKPSESHPWRTAPSNEVIKWAKQQSETTNVQNVRVARSEGLARKDRKRFEGGLK